MGRGRSPAARANRSLAVRERRQERDERLLQQKVAEQKFREDHQRAALAVAKDWRAAADVYGITDKAERQGFYQGTRASASPRSNEWDYMDSAEDKYAAKHGKKAGVAFARGYLWYASYA